MKRLLALAVAVAAFTMMAQSEASAQGYAGGYQFGTGINAIHGGGFIRGFQREQPPYFAKFPPVYYSHIVKRPYGVSPYAAPSGIAPVELGISAEPVIITIKNPFYQKKAAPVKAPAQPKADGQNKVTMITNPFVSEVAIR